MREMKNNETTVTFKHDLKIGDRVFYRNDNDEPRYTVLEVEVTAIIIEVDGHGAKVFRYECRTPFENGMTTVCISGLYDSKVYRDLQEVANYQNSGYFSRIAMLDRSRNLVASTDVGIEEKIDSEWKLIVPCTMTKEERLGIKENRWRIF